MTVVEILVNVLVVVAIHVVQSLLTLRMKKKSSTSNDSNNNEESNTSKSKLTDLDLPVREKNSIFHQWELIVLAFYLALDFHQPFL